MVHDYSGRLLKAHDWRENLHIIVGIIDADRHLMNAYISWMVFWKELFCEVDRVSRQRMEFTLNHNVTIITTPVLYVYVIALYMNVYMFVPLTILLHFWWSHSIMCFCVIPWCVMASGSIYLFCRNWFYIGANYYYYCCCSSSSNSRSDSKRSSSSIVWRSLYHWIA